MYMGSGEWLTSDSPPSVRIKLHTVQPVNAAGKGAGNGGGRYVQRLNFSFCKKLITNIFRYVILIARYCVFSYPG